MGVAVAERKRMWTVEHRAGSDPDHQLDHVVLMGGEVSARFAFQEDADFFAEAAELRPATNYSRPEDRTYSSVAEHYMEPDGGEGR